MQFGINRKTLPKGNAFSCSGRISSIMFRRVYLDNKGHLCLTGLTKIDTIKKTCTYIVSATTLRMLTGEICKHNNNGLKSSIVMFVLVHAVFTGELPQLALPIRDRALGTSEPILRRLIYFYNPNDNQLFFFCRLYRCVVCMHLYFPSCKIQAAFDFILMHNKSDKV